MGAYDDRIKDGHKPNNFFSVTSSTTALSYTVNQGGSQKEITSVKVNNNGATAGQNILVSTDGGSNFFAVTPLNKIDIPTHSTREIQIKSASGTPAYDLWFSSRQ